MLLLAVLFSLSSNIKGSRDHSKKSGNFAGTPVVAIHSSMCVSSSTRRPDRANGLLASKQVNGVPVVPQQFVPTAQKSTVPLGGIANPADVLDALPAASRGSRITGATQ
eukprot:Skav219791  [mRNA]  locus=scaffold3701:127677:128952:- [translate_table: standard]